jgi:hypothetical protein
MAVTIRHDFVSDKLDGPHTEMLQPSHWNAEHVLTALADLIHTGPEPPTDPDKQPFWVDTTMI